MQLDLLLIIYIAIRKTNKVLSCNNFFRPPAVLSSFSIDALGYLKESTIQKVCTHIL